MTAALRRVSRLMVSVLGVVLLVGVAAAGIALVAVPMATDSRPLTVLSGSMRPTYAPGDVVVVRPTDPDTLRVGQVITFQPRSADPALTTHRISGIRVTDEGREFVARGDASGADDPTPISAAQVRGEVWYSVPVVGYAATWVSSETARIAIDVGAVLLLLYALVQIVSAIRSRRRGPQTVLPGPRVSPQGLEATDPSSSRRSPAA